MAAHGPRISPGEGEYPTEQENKKKLRVGDLKVEPFEPGKREESGIAVMELTAPEPCGETDDFWGCASYERCPESHPYQKICV